MTQKPSRLEFLFAGIVLFLSGGALLPALRIQQGADFENGEPFTRALWFVIYTVVLVLAVQNRSQIAEAFAHSKVLLALVAAALLSALWSPVPWLTLRHGIALLGTSLIGIYLGSRFTLRGQLKLLVWVLGICAVLSLAFVILLPRLGFSGPPDDGAWQGVFTHKNSLGRMMMLCTVVYLLYPGFGRNHRWLKWGGVALSCVLTAFSRSVTSIILLLLLLALFPVLHGVRTRARWLWWTVGSGLATLALIVGWILTNLGMVFGLVSKDLTLTGRVPLWIGVWDAISERPWLGYGYGGFWLGSNSNSFWVQVAAGWEAPHAHNGFLDLWLALGTVGGVLFLICYGLAFAGAARWVRTSTTSVGLWPMVYLLFLFVTNLTETSILVQNTIYWILFVAVAVKCNSVVLVSEPRQVCSRPVPSESPA